MKKNRVLICPNCNSKHILFGKDHVVYRYWEQIPDCPTYYHEWEQTDDVDELDDSLIECQCKDCNELWKVDGSLHEYLGEPE